MLPKKYFQLLVISLFPLMACTQTDNAELQKMYNEDQNARMVKDIDWTILSKQDKEREKRVYEMIKGGLIITSKDYYNSAMIFQHGNDTTASAMAVTQMRKAIELDSTINKWLLAAAIDRNLMRREKPQIYGTQYVINNGDTKWTRYTIDTTQITDEQRKYYNVETLAEQLEMERNLNLKSISDYHATTNSIQKTISFIKAEYKKGRNSAYNISQYGISSFGNELLTANKLEEAMQIFELNTKLYPKNYKAFDNLGKCLFLLGNKVAGIKAYKKSLELNPKNENVRKKITNATIL